MTCCEFPWLYADVFAKQLFSCYILFDEAHRDVPEQHDVIH